MYVIREILHCKPGKVRQMADKFRAISHALQEMGHQPMRLLTDVTGEPFWTIVAEASVEQIDDFFAVEQKLTANESVRKVMADYHDLVESGRREIYRVES
jgi:hypothetical protein